MKRIPLLLFIAFLFVYCNKETNSPESALPSLPCLCCDTSLVPIQPFVGITDTSSWIYIPTAFTPNADGHNDCFTIKGGGISNYTITILDSTTSVVAVVNDTCWNGNSFSDGRYHCMIDGVSSDSSLFHYELFIYLVQDLTSSNSGFLNFPNGKDDCTFSDMIDDQFGFIYPTQENLSNWGN